MTRRARILATVEGYAVEGGFDRPHGPQTCFAPSTSLGRHLAPGDDVDLWHEYEAVLDLVPGLGLDGVRLSVEWARIEPRRGIVDDVALRRYAEVVRHARGLGLDVTVTLVDAAWPSWLGQEAWLLPWVVPHVLDHARRIVNVLGGDITGLVAFSDPRGIVRRGFLDGVAPPWRRGASDDAASADRQIEQIIIALGDDVDVASRVVPSWRVVDLYGVRGEVAHSMFEASGCDEIYVRSLVRGVGPTAAAVGLLVKDPTGWSCDPDGLLDLWR